MVIAFAVVFCVDSLTWLPLLNGGLEAAAAATMRFCSTFNDEKNGVRDALPAAYPQLEATKQRHAAEGCL